MICGNTKSRCCGRRHDAASSNPPDVAPCSPPSGTLRAGCAGGFRPSLTATAPRTDAISGRDGKAPLSRTGRDSPAYKRTIFQNLTDTTKRGMPGKSKLGALWPRSLSYCLICLKHCMLISWPRLAILPVGDLPCAGRNELDCQPNCGNCFRAYGVRPPEQPAGLEDRNHFKEDLMPTLRVPHHEGSKNAAKGESRNSLAVHSSGSIGADRTLHNTASSHQEASHWSSSLAYPAKFR